ncbi:hypothetical protein ACWGH4_21825 [Streptomyces sp. NPDC054847]
MARVVDQPLLTRLSTTAAGTVVSAVTAASAATATTLRGAARLGATAVRPFLTM